MCRSVSAVDASIARPATLLPGRPCLIRSLALSFAEHRNRSFSCRQQDSKHNSTTSTSPKHTTPAFQVTAPRDLIPQRSPTATTRSPFFQPPTIFPDSDSDSVESNGEKRALAVRTSSEAARFLRQFQTGVERPPSRTRPSRSSANVPSLTHSLTSSASASEPYTPFSEPDRAFPFRRSVGHSRGSRSVDVTTPDGCLPTAPASIETITKQTYDMNLQRVGPSHPTPNSKNDHKAPGYEKMVVSSRGVPPGQSSLKRLLGSTGGPMSPDRRA